MKKIFLLLMIFGFTSAYGYLYKVINKSSRDVYAYLAYVRPVTDLLGCQSGPQVSLTSGEEKTVGNSASACLLSALDVRDLKNTNNRLVMRDVTLIGGGGLAGNLTFLIFDQKGQGPFVQWDHGIKDAWDPADRSKRRPFPGDKTKELPVVEVKN